MICAQGVGRAKINQREADSLVGTLAGGQSPKPLKAIVECGLQAVGRGVPELHRAILRPCDDDGQLWVEADGADIVPMALERLDAGLRLVVPHLGQLVICA